MILATDQIKFSVIVVQLLLDYGADSNNQKILNYLFTETIDKNMFEVNGTLL